MKKISLALGGGGTKGFAHIGVLKRLLDLGYQPAAIAGTSAGGIVGALFACGYHIDRIHEIAKTLEYAKLFSLNMKDPPSLLGLSGLFSVLEKYIGDRRIEELEIPFAVCTVDNKSGVEYIINQGPILDALKATTAVSGVFPPLVYKDLELVDGGVLNPVPINIARWLDDRYPVVAVSLTAPRDKWNQLPQYDIPSYIPIPGFLASQLTNLRLGKAVKTFADSLELMMNMIAWLRIKEDKPEVLIIPEVYHHTMYADVDIDEMIELGEKAATEKADAIKKAFSMMTRAARWLRASKPPGKLLEW